MNNDYQYKERQVTLDQEREFRFGEGRISSYLSLLLGFIGLMSVLAYLFPEYLTTKELREAYDAELLQQALKYVLWTGGFFGVLALILYKKKLPPLIGLGFTVTAALLGGSRVEVGAVAAKPLSLGVDWLILAFLGSVIVFTTLEKLFPKYRDQVILRKEWELDFGYFCFNHLLISVILLIGNAVVSKFDWLASDAMQNYVQALPIIVQVVMLIIVADFILYWEHRTFHEIPRLWKVHAVHHSTETLDWLAGSRGHFVQIFIERSLVMTGLYLLGASKLALDIYVTFAALQAVLIHANLGLNFGPLKYLLVTPQYHHWHHSSEKPAIDTNYSAHTPLFDKLFGTYHMPSEHWPAEYGTTKRLPRTFIGQLLYPFRKK